MICTNNGSARTSRQASFNEQVPEKEPTHVKLGVVARLRKEIPNAQSNKALAAMVADFAKVTNRSNGRTITKVMNVLIDGRCRSWTESISKQDGFAFLAGLSEKLVDLQ
jgi:casein kinase 1